MSFGFFNRSKVRFRRTSAAQAVIYACVAVLSISQASQAQQDYKLSDSDTWVQTSAIDPESPEGKLAEAKRWLAAGEHARAQRAATRWIDRNPRHPQLAEAYIVRADALLAQNEEYKALYDYEYVARVYPGTELFVTALERELEIATAYAQGKRRKLLGMRIAPADDEAQELLIRIQERMPGSRLGEQAGMVLGDFYFSNGNMKLAADAYELFLENYPRSEQAPKARQRLIAAHLATFRGPEFETAGLLEAQERLLQLKTAQPALAQRLNADTVLRRIDEADAHKMLRTAQWYLRTGDSIAAELTIRRLVKKYPRSNAAADALELIPEILPQLPKSVIEAAPDYSAMRAALAQSDHDKTQ